MNTGEILPTSARATAITINETCTLIGIGRSKLYSLIGEGKLPARKIGRRTVILREDALAVLRDAPMMPTKAA